MSKSYLPHLSLPAIASGCLALSLLVIPFSCRRGDGELPPDDVRKSIGIVGDNNAARFASICSYPIQRPYPLRDVEDSVEMMDYYDIMVDDSLRSAVKKAKLSDWYQLGWRGWTFSDGQYVWLDDGRVYDVSYISPAERSLRDILAEREMATLPQQLRAGWTPENCLLDLDNGAIYRIDASLRRDMPEDSLYRLSVYDNDRKLTEAPSVIVSGTRKTEGSGAIRTYYFRRDDGSSIEYSPDDPDDSNTPAIIFKSPGEKPLLHHVRRAYWRDWFAPDRGNMADSLASPAS